MKKLYKELEQACRLNKLKEVTDLLKDNKLINSSTPLGDITDLIKISATHQTPDLIKYFFSMPAFQAAITTHNWNEILSYAFERSEMNIITYLIENTSLGSFFENGNKIVILSDTIYHEDIPLLDYLIDSYKNHTPIFNEIRKLIVSYTDDDQEKIIQKIVHDWHFTIEEELMENKPNLLAQYQNRQFKEQLDKSLNTQSLNKRKVKI